MIYLEVSFKILNHMCNFCLFLIDALILLHFIMEDSLYSTNSLTICWFFDIYFVAFSQVLQIFPCML